MQANTHPQDQLRLINQRGADFRRIATEERLAAQIKSDRRARKPQAGGLAQPTWRRRVLAFSMVTLVAVGIGALSTRAEASSVEVDDLSVSPCDHPDGYRPTCSMVSGQPDGWYQVDAVEVSQPNSSPRPDMSRIR